MAAIIYKNRAGVRLPSVTGICKHVEGGQEGLLNWAWKLGTEGIELEEARQAAASIGSVVHAAIEGELKGSPVDLSAVTGEMREGVDKALAAWALWKEEHPFEVIASELSLVSEAHQYGGTLDAVLRMKLTGLRTLFDFKSGNGLYPKDVAQAAGYGIAYDEIHPDAPIERYALLRLDKETGSPSHKNFDAAMMEPAKRAFLTARELYGLAGTLKKLAR